MIKKFLFLIFSILVTGAQAQQYFIKDLTGRWHNNEKDRSGDLQFLDEGKAVFLSTGGMVYAYIDYTAEVKKNIINLKYTADVNRVKNPNHQVAQIEFLSDSAFVFTIGRPPGGTIFGDPGNDLRKEHIYHRVRTEKPGTQLRMPNYRDLIGKWALTFKDNIKNTALYFVDEDHAVVQEGENVEELIYRADFSKQPFAIDFYYTSTSKTQQAFFQFDTDNSIRMEMFPKSNRGDHFTQMGLNMWYARQKMDSAK